jgi:hypothetical protein
MGTQLAVSAINLSGRATRPHEKLFLKSRIWFSRFFIEEGGTLAGDYLDLLIFALVGALQLIYIELFHFKHRVYDTLPTLGVFILHHPSKGDRDDLPGDAISILEPAALLLPAILGQLIPELIDLLLRFAVDIERDGRCELVHRAAVERHEILALELECNDRYGSGMVGIFIFETVDFDYLRIIKNGSVIIHRFLSLFIEPQKWDYFLHDQILSSIDLSETILIIKA